MNNPKGETTQYLHTCLRTILLIQLTDWPEDKMRYVAMLDEIVSRIPAPPKFKVEYVERERG